MIVKRRLFVSASTVRTVESRLRILYQIGSPTALQCNAMYSFTIVTSILELYKKFFSSEKISCVVGRTNCASTLVASRYEKVDILPFSESELNARDIIGLACSNQGAALYVSYFFYKTNFPVLSITTSFMCYPYPRSGVSVCAMGESLLNFYSFGLACGTSRFSYGARLKGVKVLECLQDDVTKFS